MNLLKCDFGFPEFVTWARFQPRLREAESRRGATAAAKFWEPLGRAMALPAERLGRKNVRVGKFCHCRPSVGDAMRPDAVYRMRCDAMHPNAVYRMRRDAMQPHVVHRMQCIAFDAMRPHAVHRMRCDASAPHAVHRTRCHCPRVRPKWTPGGPK